MPSAVNPQELALPQRRPYLPGEPLMPSPQFSKETWVKRL
jgi:hypothetical protein